MAAASSYERMKIVENMLKYKDELFALQTRPKSFSRMICLVKIKFSYRQTIRDYKELFGYLDVFIVKDRLSKDPTYMPTNKDLFYARQQHSLWKAICD